MKRMLIAVLCLSFLAVSSLAYAGDVYVTENGKKYHKEDCRWIKNRKTIKLDEKEAIEQGYTPCSRCLKEKAEDLKGQEDSKAEKSEKSEKKKK